MQETLQALFHHKVITVVMAMPTLRHMQLVVVAALLQLGEMATMPPQLAALEEMEPHRQLAAAALPMLAVEAAADFKLQLGVQAELEVAVLAHQQPPELMEV